MNFDPSTKIAMASAIYFKASWLFTFHPAQPGNFYVSKGETKTVQMMNMRRRFHWGEIDDYAQWAAIPYRSQDSLVIILPNKNEDLKSVMGKLNEGTMQEILDNVNDEVFEVRIDR